MSGIGTKCVQAGYTPGSGEPRQVPIIQSTTFKYDYQRATWESSSIWRPAAISTPGCKTPPTTRWQPKSAALEGGSAAMLTSSGQAANFYAVFNIASCGDHVVSSSSIYGGSYNLFAVTMKRMGVDFTFVEPGLHTRRSWTQPSGPIPRPFSARPSPIRR